VGIAAASVLMTWLYLNSRRSVLIAVVFHWSGNLTGEVLQPAPAVDAVRLALGAAAAALVVGAGFPRVLRPRTA
jgi:membrane protease YdiL (CAAX protease family)